MDATTLTGLVPLVVGVTGHRDLRAEDIPDLQSEARAVLDEIAAKEPDRPMVLLTPLAEGADSLVARIAIERGMRLVVALPFAQSEYEKTFSDGGRREFGEVICNPAVVNTIELPPVRTGRLALTDEDRRALQYALVGAYVAHHSDILIALWSGAESRRVGGTAQVVHYRRTGSFEIDPEWLARLAEVPEPFDVRESLLDPPDVGPLYHIATPRRDHEDERPAIEHAYVLPSLYAGQGAAAAYTEHLDDIASHVAAFNKDARALVLAQNARIDKSAQDLFPDPKAVDAAALPAGLAALRRTFAMADALAIGFQRYVQRALLAIFVLIFVAAAAFAVYAHGFDEGQAAASVMIGVYGSMLTAADVIFLVARMRRWQDKHQDYRAVAEGLRVQFYWRLAGLRHSAADYYVRKQRDELSWIPRVVGACGIAAPVAESESPVDRLGVVQTLWVSRQADYYNTARSRAERSLRWRNAGSGALAGSLLIGLALLWRASFESSALRVVFTVFAATLALHFVFTVREVFGGERGSRDSRALAGETTARVAGLVIALVLMVPLVNIPHWLAGRPDWAPTPPSDWLLIALSIAAVGGALLQGHADTRAVAEHARQYGRMAAVFRRASDRLEHLLATGDERRARELVMELGKEALNDHGDWVMLHRERPIEVPETA